MPAGTDSDVASKFLNFFDNKITSIRNVLDNACIDIPTFKEFNGDAFVSFEHVTEDEVGTIIKNSPTKHCDLDPMPTFLLKECLDVLLKCITKIINNSLTTGEVPQCFKKALINPLLKKPGIDSEELSNFRPVSNLPFLSKILEKVVLKRLMSHVSHNHLSETLQSAYKAIHSTETALLKVLTDMLNFIDQKKVCLISLLDLSAAFDTIDHSVLITRLNRTFGITGTALDWFTSYLQGRSQRVKVQNTCSPEAVLKFGVPQGSVLGPILFTMYTQPLVDILKTHCMSYHRYADDTQIYQSAYVENISELKPATEQCIQDVKIWMNVNKLKLNDSKTEVMLCSNPQNVDQDLDFKLEINGNDINSSSKIKNLGVMFDEDLSMSSQVSNICQKTYFQLRKIASIRKFLTESATTTLVTTLILSNLDYCNSLLSGITAESLSKLQMVQNHAAKLIKRKKKFDHVTPLLFDLHWLPVKQRIHYKICLLCYKALNNSAPCYIKDILTVYTPARDLRSSSDKTIFTKPKPKLKAYGERAFSYYGPHVWNDLPFSIRNCPDIHSFKRNLKHHLFVKNFY